MDLGGTGKVTDFPAFAVAFNRGGCNSRRSENKSKIKYQRQRKTPT
jgi:hypothetical protein